MTETADTLDAMHILAGALPFLKRYDDATVVVKYGGHAMGQEDTALRFGRDIALLEQVGVNPVVVHGGGPQINAMLKRLNVKSTFVQGLRVTDEEMLDVVEMVLAGPVNKQVAEAITRAGVMAVGISGKDGGLIRARQLQRTYRDPESNIEKVLDLGFVGEPESVDPKVLRLMIGADIVPVVAPVGVGADGQTYNINADTAAGRHRRRAERRAAADADRCGRRARRREAADPGNERRRGEGRHRRGLDRRRHDPEGRDLHLCDRAWREGRGHPRWARAARHSGGTVHRCRAGHPDPALTADGRRARRRQAWLRSASAGRAIREPRHPRAPWPGPLLSPDRGGP